MGLSPLQAELLARTGPKPYFQRHFKPKPPKFDSFHITALSHVLGLHKSDIDQHGLYHDNLFVRPESYSQGISIRVTRAGPGESVRFIFSAPFSEDKILISIKLGIIFSGKIAEQLDYLDQRCKRIEKAADFHVVEVKNDEHTTRLQEAAVELTSLEYACADVIMVYCEKPDRAYEVKQELRTEEKIKDILLTKENNGQTPYLILKQLIELWRNLFGIKNNGDMEFRERYYAAAVKQLSNLDYSAKDVERLCTFLTKSQNEEDFSIRAGLFLSALVNCGRDSVYVLNTNNFKMRIHYLGYLNNKTISINGDAGNYLGFGMKGGVITVDSAGDFLAFQMQGGAIYVQGSVGVYSGHQMLGGEFHYNHDKVGRLLVVHGTP